MGVEGPELQCVKLKWEISSLFYGFVVYVIILCKPLVVSVYSVPRNDVNMNRMNVVINNHAHHRLFIRHVFSEEPPRETAPCLSSAMT